MATARRTIALGACLALAAVYAWFAARSFQAARLAASLDVPSLERAVALQPRDASYQDLLCRYLLFDKQDAAAALPRCVRATELDRYQSAYWLDLALVYYTTGAEQQQEQAIRMAVAVDPMTPDVAWTAANFFLAQGKTAEALHQFGIAMRGDLNNVQPAVELCWRRLHDANAIQGILPPDPAAYLQFVRLLTANDQWDAANRAWSAMTELNKPVDAQRALFYVDALIDRRQAARANQAWEQLVAHSAMLAPYGRKDNLLVDGGFEQPILNAGFDWRYSPESGSVAAPEPDQAHSGNQSLAISYSGVNRDAGILQYVPVKPNTQYTISGWVKSQRLDAANGPVISVADTNDNKLLAKTQETLDTTPWHRVDTVFRTGPQTELIAIRITRDPADTHISGKFWVDDLSLR
jgi:tetratricopeptide (TPR) repeat protein